MSGNVYNVYRGNGNNDYKLSSIPSSLFPGTPRYGVTYNVRVAAYVGGVWLNFGASCPVTAPSAASVSTSLLGVCGTTLAVGQFNLPIWFPPVAGASNYAFEITGAFTNGGTQRIVYKNNANNNLYLSSTYQAGNLPNMKPNLVYTVRIAYYAGAWSSYGAPCTFTTAASIPRYSPFSSEDVEEAASSLSLSVYPNPATVAQQYALELQGINSANEKVQISIYNLLGDKVYRAEVITKEETILTIKPEVNLAAGVYMAEAQLNGNVCRVKFVVK